MTSYIRTLLQLWITFGIVSVAASGIVPAQPSNLDADSTEAIASSIAHCRFTARTHRNVPTQRGIMLKGINANENIALISQDENRLGNQARTVDAMRFNEEGKVAPITTTARPIRHESFYDFGLLNVQSPETCCTVGIGVRLPIPGDSVACFFAPKVVSRNRVANLRHVKLTVQKTLDLGWTTLFLCELPTDVESSHIIGFFNSQAELIGVPVHVSPRDRQHIEANQIAFASVIDFTDILQKHGVDLPKAAMELGLKRKIDRLDTYGRPVTGNGLTISWSDAHDELQGLSDKTGKWTNLKISHQELIEPNVGDQLAYVKLKQSIAAYSAESGTWDTLDVEGVESADASFQGSSVRVFVGPENRFYAFPLHAGVWTSPTDPNYRDTEITVTTVKSAQEVSDFLKTVDCRGIRFLPASGRRTKISGVKRHVDRVARLLREFSKAKTTSAVRLDEPSPGATSGRQRSAAGEKSLRLAQELRNSANVSNAERNELSALVAEALDDRMAHQRQLAKQLEEKLSVIQTALAAREAIRDKIIVRRVDELLDPKIAWATLEDRAPSQPKTVSTVVSSPPTESSARVPQPSISNMQSTADIVHELNIRRNIVVTLGIQQITKVNAELAEWELPLETLRKERSEPDLEEERRQSMIETRRSKLNQLRDSTRGSLSIWQNAWRALESVIARKELQLQATVLKAEMARQQLQTMKQQVVKGDLSSSHIQQATLRLKLAENEVQQAKASLAPYKAIEKDSPHLNPKTLDVADLLKSPTSQSDHSE